MAFQTFVEMFDGISDEEKKRLWERLLEGKLPLKEVSIIDDDKGTIHRTYDRVQPPSCVH